MLQTEADAQLDRRRREQELITALLAGERRAAAARWKPTATSRSGP